jgi:cell division protein FtsB
VADRRHREHRPSERARLRTTVASLEARVAEVEAEVHLLRKTLLEALADARSRSSRPPAKA